MLAILNYQRKFNLKCFPMCCFILRGDTHELLTCFELLSSTISFRVIDRLWPHFWKSISPIPKLSLWQTWMHGHLDGGKRWAGVSLNPQPHMQVLHYKQDGIGGEATCFYRETCLNQVNYHVMESSMKMEKDPSRGPRLWNWVIILFERIRCNTLDGAWKHLLFCRSL